MEYAWTPGEGYTDSLKEYRANGVGVVGVYSGAQSISRAIGIRASSWVLLKTESLDNVILEFWLA